MASAEVFHGVKLAHNIKDSQRQYAPIYTATMVRDFHRLGVEKGLRQYDMGVLIGLQASNAQGAMSRYVAGTAVIRLKELERLNEQMRKWGHEGWSDEALLACHAHDTQVRVQAADEARKAALKRLNAAKKQQAGKAEAIRAKNEEIGKVLKPEPPPPNRAVGFVLPKREPRKPQDVRADVVEWVRKVFKMKPTDTLDNTVVIALDPLVSALTKFIMELEDK